MIGEKHNMNDKEEFICNEDIDRVHHYLEEQIAYICVEEEEERMKEEIRNNKD